MKYLIYNTEAEAQAYADAASAILPHGDSDITIVWDIPQLITNNRWVVASTDNTGEPWGEDWSIE
jgi:hypothetical protein